MDNVCPVCGGDSLEVEYMRNRLVLVCSECGHKVNPNIGTESESDDGDYVDDDSEGTEEDDVDSNGPADNKSGKTAVAHIDSDFKTVRVTPYAILSDPQKNELSAHIEPEKAPNVSGASLPSCKVCGGTDFSQETVNDTDQLVCTNCGYFSETQHLVSTVDYTVVSGPTNSYQWPKESRPRFFGSEPALAKGKDAGIQKIRSLSERLTMQPDVVDQAVALFEQLYSDYRVIGVSIELKETLAACCLLSVARENGINITIKTMTTLHHARKKLYTRSLRLLKETGNRMCPQSIVSLPHHVLSGANFSNQMLQRVSSAVELCQQCFITQGKDYTSFIVTVAHACWISDNPVLSNTKLKNFCSQFNLPYSGQCEVLKKHLYELLVKLASELPWITTKIHKSKAVLYLNDILKYKKTVLSRADLRGQNASDDKSSYSSQAIIPPSMRKRLGESNSIDIHETQLPPHLANVDLDRHDLDHENDVISESEMESYLVPPDEIPLKKALMKFESATKNIADVTTKKK